MISNQIIQNSVEELNAITKVEFSIMDLDGIVIASTTEKMELETSLILNFAESPADSQIISGNHLLKILDEGEVAYVLIAKGRNEDAYIIGKVAVSQIQNLIVAYKEKFDKNSFFQNLILDNLLLVDIYNRAKKLHIVDEIKRAVFIIETKSDKDSDTMEMLKSLYSSYSGDYVTAVDERNIILIKALPANVEYEELEGIASTIVDMMSTEAMIAVKVSYGSIVNELREVSKSFKEAKMALDVGKIFYIEKSVMAYKTLGIGRLIYQLPINLCRIFIQEIFGDNLPTDIDEETIITIHKFFENNLNVSETSRQLFVHRNTLVYRIEKLEKRTGLDIRTFDDALTLKIALMVVNYMNYLDSLE